jgi:hypothetical protein
MRGLFRNPDPFINEAVRLAVLNGYEGYNLDFEPKVNVTKEDSILYANFIDLFSKKLHLVNKKLQVDVATWTPLWDFELISKTSVDTIITMSTYAGRFDTFTTALAKAIREIKKEKLNVGKKF